MIIELLKRITNILEKNHFPYMVSGSHALNWYASPRITMDIDIVIELNTDNVEHFISLFHKGFYINKEIIIKETKSQGIFNIIDLDTSFKIDFIVKKNHEYRIIEFERRKRIKYEDFEMWIVTPEDLIISKLIWIQDYQSDKQIEDIKTLLKLNDLEMNYILDWCEKLELATFNLL